MVSSCPGARSALSGDEKSSMNQFLGWSLSLGHIAGIPVRAHWTLLLLTAFRVLGERTPMAMGWQLAVCVVLWLTVLIHELGHAFAARGVGGEAHQIMLWPLGGLALTSHKGGLKEAIKVVLGGPLTHIPLAVVFARLLMIQGVAWDWAYLNPLSEWPMLQGGFWAYLFFYGLKIQVALFLFNMFVPCYPFDGGQLFANLLLFRLSRRRTAQVLIAFSSLSALVLVVVFREVFLTLFIVFEIYQMATLYSANALGQHPLFARAPDHPERGRRTPPGPRPGGGAKVLTFRRPGSEKPSPEPQGSASSTSTAVKPCPYCKRELPQSAKMCGRCERMLP